MARAELCRRSLFYFLKEFWLNLATDSYVHNWHIEYLCDEIQLVVDKYVLDRQPHVVDKWYQGISENVSKNLIVNISPGTTKSTVISRALPAWLWANDDSKTIIGSTIDGKNATEFSTSTIDLINSDKYQLYFPKVKIRRDVSAKTFYQSESGGKRYSLTTRGSKTGKHADVLIDDDPMDYETAQSPQEAKRCIEGFKALQTRKKDKKKVPYILVMQRLSSRDTTSHALKSLKDVRHICLPAEDKHNNINPPDLKEYYIEGLLDQKRLGRDVLKEMKMGLKDESKPMSDIASEIQFNQISVSSEGSLYEKINFVERLPEPETMSFRFSFTDVADTGSDYFCTWFGEVNNGRIYIFDAIYTQEGSKVTNRKIQEKISLHNSIINRMETNNQGSVYVTMLQQQGVNVTGYTSTSNKEERITAWAQFSGYVSFLEYGAMPYHTNEYNMAISHLKAYPKQGKAEDGHDDAEDAFSEVLRYLFTNHRYLFGG